MKIVKLNNGFESIVDDDDFERISNLKWMVTGCRAYARNCIVTNGKQKTTLLHRFIMNPPPKLIVDHIDRNGLNNQKHNLRVVNKAQNAVNSKKIRSKYKYKGVKKHRSGKWNAFCTVNNKYVHLGTFNTIEEAAMAYDTAVRKHFGDVANFNFPHKGSSLVGKP